jgi:hypothetical protein
MTHRILFFLYSSQFDEVIEAHILDSDDKRAGVSDSLTPREILSRKAQLLEPNFKQLVVLFSVRDLSGDRCLRRVQSSVLGRVHLHSTAA